MKKAAALAVAVARKKKKGRKKKTPRQNTKLPNKIQQGQPIQCLKWTQLQRVLKIKTMIIFS